MNDTRSAGHVASSLSCLTSDQVPAADCSVTDAKGQCLAMAGAERYDVATGEQLRIGDQVDNLATVVQLDGGKRVPASSITSARMKSSVTMRPKNE